MKMRSVVATGNLPASGCKTLSVVIRAVLCWLALGSFIVPAASLAQTQKAVPQLSGLPTPLTWQNETVEWSAGNGKLLSLAAGKKTDWFVWPGEGDYRPDSSPRLLFKANDNFSFRTKVDVTARAIYDAGCVALYGTASTGPNYASKRRPTAAYRSSPWSPAISRTMSPRTR
ncbi:DUF1349 domain-containing protein [Duganella sp. Dugasp56]|uniref:DUF1349 domain-containing protein n=1 Tax=Duganella sp. Dugasp56 TaxID=3243046 RepID=UPI0039AFE581